MAKLIILGPIFLSCKNAGRPKLSTYSEADILEGFLRREEAALAALHALLYAPLRYFAEKLLLHQSLAEEAVTDVFVKTWQGTTPFSSYSHLRNYLFEAVRNECINILKKQDRYAKHLRRYGEIIENNIAGFENEQLETAALEIIFEIAGGLPTACKQVFDLLYKQQLDYQEVASQLNISVQTVRNQRTRAIAFIRKQLKARSLLWLLIFLK